MELGFNLVFPIFFFPPVTFPMFRFSFFMAGFLLILGW